MLLFNNDFSAILMIQYGETWDLPYFVYPDSLKYCVFFCCQDLEKNLSVSIPSCANPFSVIAELYGEVESCGMNDDGDNGFGRLMLTECHLEQLRLPQHAAWKNYLFLSSLLDDSCRAEDSRMCIQDVMRYLREPRSLISACTDPRYQYGWYDRAVAWFLSSVSGRDWKSSGTMVLQEQVIATSTVMRADMNGARFYLKAPALGLNEVSITAKIASLFPNSSPSIIATSTELNCFIARGFHKVDLDESRYAELVKKLAYFQFESLNFIEELKRAGCDVRSPKRMAKKLQEWSSDRDMERMFKDLFSDFKSYVPIFVELLGRLNAFNVPLTLVHGDFSGGNAGFKTEREENDNIILFDWQYACIGHPFFDLHEVTVHNDFPENVINDYLDLWAGYESRERAREALEIARILGWTLKMWTSLDCLKECNPQKVSSLEYIVVDAFKVMVDQIETRTLQSSVG